MDKSIILIKTLCLLTIVWEKTTCKCFTDTFEDSEIIDDDQTADFDFAQAGKAKTINCCSQNFSSILWYFSSGMYPQWRMFPWEPYCSNCDYRPRLEDNNQTFLLTEAGEMDSGVYKCVAFSENNTVLDEHNTTIEVYSCTERLSPLYIEPQDQHTSLGETVSFSCSGDFGCSSDGTQHVDWYDENYDTINSSRYMVNIVTKHGNTLVEATLTISSVEVSDYDRTFICLVASSADYQFFNVKLKKKLTTVHTTVTTGVVVAIVLSGCIFVFGILLLLFRHRIQLFIRSRIPYGHLKDKGNKDYHALILHDDDDQKTAEEIKRKLEADSYIIKTSGEIKPGRNILGKISNYSERSGSLIIIYPHKGCSTEFKRAIAAQQYFEPSVITVVKKRSSVKQTVDTLEDKGLFKLVFPDTVYCTPYREDRFYCKLKLRMPRRNSNTLCCTSKARRNDLGDVGHDVGIPIDLGHVDIANADFITHL